MALSPKERERIIEEETLRYETRQNLLKKYCAERPVRWPWVLLGVALVVGLWSYIFCGSAFCLNQGPACHEGMMGKKCPVHGMSWAPDEKAKEAEKK